MTVDEIINIFKIISPEEEVGSIAKNSKGFIIYLTRPKLKNGEYVEDNLYLLTNDKKISSFNPNNDRELYKEGLKNIIYKRPGL